MITALAVPNLLSVLGVGWLVAGIGTALALRHRGHPDATAVAAIAAWPMLLPLLQSEGPTQAPGPLATHIDQAFDALTATLADPAVQDLPWGDSLEDLRSALHDVDGRMGLADRLLEQTPTGVATQLVDARRNAEAEVRAVLDEVVQLRLQVGLAALAGDTRALRGRLQELLDRARSLDEVSHLSRGHKPSPLDGQ